MTLVARCAAEIRQRVAAAARFVRFALETVRGLRALPRLWQPFLDHLAHLGARSVPVTMMVAAFVGGIMAIQVELELRDFGAVSYLGGLSASVTFRTVGPALIAFLLAGRVGAYTAAELATMRVTEQIDALRVLGADPIEALVAPRFLAAAVASFLLLFCGLVATIAGGVIVASTRLGVAPERFLLRLPELVTTQSVVAGLCKSLLFGLTIAFVSCYRGFYAEGGAKGVGEAVRVGTVHSILSILALDAFLASLGFGGGR